MPKENIEKGTQNGSRQHSPKTVLGGLEPKYRPPPRNEPKNHPAAQWQSWSRAESSEG